MPSLADSRRIAHAHITLQDAHAIYLGPLPSENVSYMFHSDLDRRRSMTAVIRAALVNRTYGKTITYTFAYF